MKNIVWLDVKTEYNDVKEVLNRLYNENIKVALLANSKAKEIKKDFGEKIGYAIPLNFKDNEFDEIYQNTYNLTYEEIKYFYPTQLKVEHFFQRRNAKRGIILYRYYVVLAFWLDFFSNNNIDMVFLTQIEHGRYTDTIAIDVARSKNIPVFTLTLSSDNGFDIISSICNEKGFINLKDIIPDYNGSSIIIEEHLNLLKKLFKKDKKQSKIYFKNPYKYFFDTKIKTLPSVVAHFFRSPKAEYIYENKKNTLVRVPKFEVFKQSFFIKRLYKLYDYLSVEPDFSKNEKFIYYPLNQEPEASIMPRALLNSQLFIIKMLANALPKDYKIYVKEHPAQFFYYEVDSYYFSNVNYYRDLSFYWQLKHIPNVEIININTPYTELIKNSQAIASICGSSLIESLFLKKPILVFGKNLSFVEILKDSFKIRSQNDVKIALDKIEKGFIPDYNDLNKVLNEYCFMESKLFKEESKEFFVKIFKALLNLS